MPGEEFDDVGVGFSDDRESTDVVIKDGGTVKMVDCAAGSCVVCDIPVCGGDEMQEHDTEGA
jgi:hypothetical protein